MTVTKRKEKEEKNVVGYCPKEERETVLRFDETVALGYIWSASRPFWAKMERLGIAPISSNSHSRSYRVPKRQIVVRKASTKTMSEEQKKAAAERLKAVRTDRKRKPGDLDPSTVPVFASNPL